MIIASQDYMQSIPCQHAGHAACSMQASCLLAHLATSLCVHMLLHVLLYEGDDVLLAEDVE